MRDLHQRLGLNPVLDNSEIFGLRWGSSCACSHSARFLRCQPHCSRSAHLHRSAVLLGNMQLIS